MNTPFTRRTRLGICALGLTLLQACAGYKAFRNGQSAMEDGRLEEGIDQLRMAMQAEPGNTEYKRHYFSKREQAIGQLSRQAEVGLDRGDVDSAESAYQQILKMQADAPVAVTGLRRIEAAKRHKQMLEAAQAAMARSDFDAAASTVQQVLSENNQHRMALTLQRKLLRQQADATGKELGIYPKLKAIYRTPVSLSFTSATVRQVFEALKLASGLNYMLDKDVQADVRVNIAVTNKPVEDVLRLITATNQLEHKILDGDTLLIYPKTSAKAAEYKDMVVRSFYLSNADVNKTSAMLKSIAKIKDVFVDERVSLLMIRDTPEVVRMAERLIAAQDMPEPEVMLELEVLEVNVNRLLEMGLRWPDTLAASVQGSLGTPGALTLSEFKDPSQSLVRLSITNPVLSATLRSQKGNATLLANPRVRVRNKQSAKVMIGEKVPVITTSTTANVGVAESVSYLDVGLKLDIEPTIALDDDVTMKVSLEVSNILDVINRSSGTQTYRLGTRNTSTVLRVRDGETNVLAGLIQKEDRRSNSGIPGLNELPLVSKLFGGATDTDNRTEIILLITPRIVRNLDVPGLGQQEFLSGTESSVGAASIQLGSPARPPNSPMQSPTPQPQQPSPQESAGEQKDTAPITPRPRRIPAAIQRMIDEGQPVPPAFQEAQPK